MDFMPLREISWEFKKKKLMWAFCFSKCEPSKYITKFVEGFSHTQNINIQHISKKNN
jgi:hypothetical protein